MKHIVFIPGVMGSELIEGKLFGGTKRWFTLKLQDFSAKRLKLTKGKKDNIHPGKPIDYGVRIFGSTFKQNIVYASILDQLGSLEIENYQFHPYGYDWRKSLWETCKDLHQLLRQFKDEEIYIVAHSMGGLLIHTYCQWATEKGFLPNIKQVITLGTPWNGSPDAFKVLNYGVEDRGWSFPTPKVTRDIARSFPSSYQLLPSSKYCEANKYLVSEGRDLRWLDCIDLVQKLDGCFIESVNVLNNEIHDSLLQQWPNSIQHFNIIGVNQGSVGVLKLDKNHQDRIEEPVDGDGVVPLLSASPFFQSKKTLYTYASHQGLVLHEPVLMWIKNVLENGNSDLIDGLMENYTSRTNWILEKIDCPVEVSIRGEEENINKPSDDITKHSIGEATYLIYNKPTPSTIEVEAYDNGRTSIETISYDDGKVKTVTKFPSVDADPARKTIIELTFKEYIPTTKVFTEDISDDSHAIEVTGVTVDVPDKITSTPPKTRIKIIALGETDRLHYDEKGIGVSFKVTEEGFKHLETRYRINEGLWRRYDKELQLTMADGLLYGKNVIEYFSIDVHDNEEKVKKKVFYIESKPEVFYRIWLNPDIGGTLTPEELYSGVKPYQYQFKLNDFDSPVQNVEGSVDFKLYEQTTLFVQAIDMFGRKNSWDKLHLSFSDLADVLWNDEGFSGTIDNIVKLLPNPEQSLEAVYIGKNEKSVFDVIPKSAKTIIVKFTNVEYVIDLLPKLEIYLEYHSEKIKRSEENIKISFLVYDSEDNPIKDILPSVRYSLIPVKNPDQDIKSPAVSSNGKGVYTFNVPVGHLSKDVKKIKFEFRDVPSRIKPITTRTFIVE